MFLGLSRDTWAQIWTALMALVIASGVAVVFSATTFGVAVMAAGLVGLIAFFSLLWVKIPRETPDRSPVWPLRAWRNLRRLRIVFAPETPVTSPRNEDEGTKRQRTLALDVPDSDDANGRRDARRVGSQLAAAFEGLGDPAFRTGARLIHRMTDSLIREADARNPSPEQRIRRTYGALVNNKLLEPAENVHGATARRFEERSDTAEEFQIGFGEFFDAYMMVRSWVIETGKCVSFPFEQDAEFQSWLAIDQRFLDRMHELVADEHLETLRPIIRRVGWGASIAQRIASNSL